MELSPRQEPYKLSPTYRPDVRFLVGLASFGYFGTQLHWSVSC